MRWWQHHLVIDPLRWNTDGARRCLSIATDWNSLLNRSFYTINIRPILNFESIERELISMLRKRLGTLVLMLIQFFGINRASNGTFCALCNMILLPLSIVSCMCNIHKDKNLRMYMLLNYIARANIAKQMKRWISQTEGDWFFQDNWVQEGLNTFTLEEREIHNSS